MAVLRAMMFASLGLLAASQVCRSADTPTGAVESFEDAYRRGDADAAAAAWDFGTAAELFLDSTGMPKALWGPMPSSLAQTIERELRSALQSKVRARFELAECRLGSITRMTASLVLLVETCRWTDGFESSQQLVTSQDTSGWRVAQYPSIRTYEPVCAMDRLTETQVCSERDGSQVTATRKGHRLWRKDSHVDWHLRPYRTPYPVVVSIAAPSPDLTEVPQYGPVKRGVLVEYDSSQSGMVDEDSGEFFFMGQN